MLAYMINCGETFILTLSWLVVLPLEAVYGDLLGTANNLYSTKL